MKRHLIRTLSLTAVLALFLAAMSATFLFAGAKEVGKSDIFDASNAENTTEYTEGQTSYLSYRLAEDGDTVQFRRNLALKWYAPAEDDPFTGEVGYFGLTIGFDNTEFDSFSVALESSQFSMSKEKKTTNTLTFTKQDAGLAVSVNGKDSGVTVATADIGSVAIAFSGDDGFGNFAVTVNGSSVDSFTNIGKYYSAYASASATTPLTPLTFSAAGVSGDGAEFHIESMNGQSFAIVNEDCDVKDETAPVLVVNNDIRGIYFGTKIDFDTVAVDVCSSTGITTSKYYYYPELGATVDEEDEDATLVLGEDSSERIYAELESDHIFFKDDFTDPAAAGVSLAYRVSDGSKSAVYLLDWSAVLGADDLISVKDPEEEEASPTTTFITYTKDGSGNITLDAPLKGDDDYDTWYEQNIKPYQDKVTAAAYKDGDVDAGESIQVGEGAYYYIPAFKEYVQDSTCGYTDMEFTVYYKTESSSTVSTVSGSYDELRIELTKEGRYQFRIVPTNSADNAMVGVFASGPDSAPRYTEKDITSDNVFDAKNIPTFEFAVQYNGASIEKPEEEEDTGYVDVTYTVDAFEIIGISDTYTEHYRLYYFQASNPSETYTAEQLRAADENGTISELGEWRQINVYDSELDEDEDDNVYSWDPDSSLSFIPQERGFYKVEVRVATENMNVVSEAKYIEISADATVIPGDTYWLENNILSLVFLGIGILCLIGIVVILLIKPKDKAQVSAESERKAALKEKRESRK